MEDVETIVDRVISSVEQIVTESETGVDTELLRNLETIRKKQEEALRSALKKHNVSTEQIKSYIHSSESEKDDISGSSKPSVSIVGFNELEQLVAEKMARVYNDLDLNKSSDNASDVKLSAFRQSEHEPDTPQLVPVESRNERDSREVEHTTPRVSVTSRTSQELASSGHQKVFIAEIKREDLHDDGDDDKEEEPQVLRSPSTDLTDSTSIATGPSPFTSRESIPSLRSQSPESPDHKPLEKTKSSDSAKPSQTDTGVDHTPSKVSHDEKDQPQSLTPKPLAPKPKPKTPKPQNSTPQSPKPKNSESQSPKPQIPKPENSEAQSTVPKSPEPQSPKPENSEPKSPKPQSPEPEASEPQSPKPVTSKPEATNSDVTSAKPKAKDKDRPKPTKQKPQGSIKQSDLDAAMDLSAPKLGHLAKSRPRPPRSQAVTRVRPNKDVSEDKPDQGFEQQGLGDFFETKVVADFTPVDSKSGGKKQSSKSDKGDGSSQDSKKSSWFALSNPFKKKSEKKTDKSPEHKSGDAKSLWVRAGRAVGRVRDKISSKGKSSRAHDKNSKKMASSMDNLMEINEESSKTHNKCTKKMAASVENLMDLDDDMSDGEIKDQPKEGSKKLLTPSGSGLGGSSMMAELQSKREEVIASDSKKEDDQPGKEDPK